MQKAIYMLNQDVKFIKELIESHKDNISQNTSSVISIKQRIEEKADEKQVNTSNNF
jgi:hypothetical protein